MGFPTIPTGARVLVLNQLNTTGTRTFPNFSGLTFAEGDMLIAIVLGYQSSTTDAQFSSWSHSLSEIHDTGTSTTLALGVAWKISDGAESGTITVTQAATITGDCSMILMSIPAGTFDPNVAPTVGTRVSGTSSAADPGALAPSWGGLETLWIALAASGMTAATGSWTATGTTAPTNYGNRVDTNASDTSTIGDCELAVSFRQNLTASEDVGTAGVDTSNARNAALVLAIRPLNPSPTEVDVVATLPTPTIIIGSPATVTPATVAVVATLPLPTFVAPAFVQPAMLAVVATTHNPHRAYTTFTIPAGVIIAWPATAASIPSGWTRVTALDGLFLRSIPNGSTEPGTTGGAATHTHTASGTHIHGLNHSHTQGNTTAGDTGTPGSGSVSGPKHDHIHSRPTTNTPTVNSGTASPSTDAVSSEPHHKRYIFIQSNGTPVGFPEGSVVFGRNFPVAPGGWDIEDANLISGDTIWFRGATAAGDGSKALFAAKLHTHDVVAHTHGATSHGHTSAASGSSPLETTPQADGTGGSMFRWSGSQHSHPVTVTDASTTSLPNSTPGATGTGQLIPGPNNYLNPLELIDGPANHVGTVAIWIGALAAIPKAWELLTDSNWVDRFLAKLADTHTSTGNSLAHSHGGNTHSHPTGGTHSHAVTIETSGNSTTSDDLIPGGTAEAAITHLHPSTTNTDTADPTPSSVSSGTTNTDNPLPPYITVAFIILTSVPVEPATVAVTVALPTPTIQISGTPAVVTPASLTLGGITTHGYLNLDGTGDYAEAPHDSSFNSITDLDIRVEVEGLYATGNYPTVAARTGATGGATDHVWNMQFLTNTGRMRSAWRTSGGSSEHSADSSVSLSSVGVDNNERVQLRVVVDVDNGASGRSVFFYYRTDLTKALADNTGWTQLGSTQTTAGVSSIRNDVSVPLLIGGELWSSADEFTGKVYGLVWVDGIDSASVLADPDFRDDDQGWSSPPADDHQGNTWSFNGNAAWVANTGSRGVIIPIPTIKVSVTPATVAVVATLPTPTAVVEATVVEPATVVVTVTLPTPTVTVAATVTPATVAVTATLATPSILAASIVVPATVVVAATLPTPVNPAQVRPIEVDVVVTLPTPSILAAATVTPATVVVLATLDTPTIETGTAVAPATIAVAVTLPTPSILAASVVTPATVVVLATLPTPTAFAADDNTALPDVVAVVVTVDTPGLSAGWIAEPDPVGLVVTLDTPTLAAEATVTPATVAVTTTLATPTVLTDINVNPATVAVTVTLPTAAVAFGWTVTPATVAVTTALSIPAITLAGFGNPARVLATVVLPTPTTVSNVIVTPGAVIVVVSLPTGAIPFQAIVVPLPVAVTVAFPAADLFYGVVVLVLVARTFGQFHRLSDDRLHIARVGRGLRRGYRANVEGYERVSGVFAFDEDTTQTATYELAMYAVALAWAAHAGSPAATLANAINYALDSYGFRQPNGQRLV